jgi:hypothetical protein
MKKYLINSSICSLLFLLISHSIICQVKIKEPTKMTFENHPPISDRVFVQKLVESDNKGNNVQILASFPQREKRLVENKSFKINLGNERDIMLEDDGKFGDKLAGDRLFSSSLKISEDDILKFAKSNNELIRRKQNVETVFIGRSAVRVKLEPFDIEAFKAGRRVAFDVVTPSIIDATTLPDIRDKSLMIRDLTVVEDVTRTYDPCRSPNKGNPNGVWSFNTLITNMANTPLTGVTPKQFLIDWVDNFVFKAITHPNSGDIAPARNTSKERLIKAWMKNSGVPVPAAAGIPVGWQSTNLKSAEFPVRLLAIVNRLDLRGNSGYGFSNAGEGRFVFCFVDSQNGCNTGGNGPGTMTFIFEYGIPLTNCNAVKNYAQSWWNLRSTPFGSTYNTALQNITKVFTDANTKPSKPNGNALNHFRTNEFIQAPWSIRDFEIDATSHKLIQIHPNKESMASSNGLALTPASTSLVTFVNSIPFASTLNPVYTIPNNLAGMHAPMPAPSHFWKGNATDVMSPINRREFSLNTCSGCHAGETLNNIFTHIKPRNVGTVAALSKFMTGLGSDDNTGDNDADAVGSLFVNDRFTPSTLPQKEFNEALRRAKDLESLIFNSPCFVRGGFPNQLLGIHQILKFRPLNMED